MRLPITGAPSDRIDDGPPPRRVALVAADYVGLRPTMHVAPGDTVTRGQLCFEDKTMPGVRYTAPAAGTVVAVNRGDRRALQSVVIDVSRAEREGRAPETASFSAFSGRHPSGMTGDDVRALLVESGQWTALRARPFGRVADPAARPHSIFVTAMDTNPLGPSVAAIVAGCDAPFERGLAALARLTDGPVFVCTGPDPGLRIPEDDRIRHEVFDGVHPAGTVGFTFTRSTRSTGTRWCGTWACRMQSRSADCSRPVCWMPRASSPWGARRSRSLGCCGRGSARRPMS